MLQVLTSCRHKVAPKIFTWYRLSMGDQTDSQVGSQVHASRKFHAYTDDLRSTCVDYLRCVAKRWKLASTCVRILSSIKIIASHRKSTQAPGGQAKRKLNASRKVFALTCVDLRAVRLARASHHLSSGEYCGGYVEFYSSRIYKCFFVSARHPNRN